MSVVDSTGVFYARLAALGLSGLKENFDAQGWNTHGSFAFSCSFNPGAENAELQSDVIPLLTGGNQVFDARVRRLHFESYAISMAEFQRRLQRTDDDTRPRAIPQEERADRL